MSQKSLPDIWIMHISMKDWCDKSMWLSYFNAAQSILKSPLTHLDTADPIRRKVETLKDAATFASTFDKGERRRWLFGKYGRLRFDFSINYYRKTMEEEKFSNTFIWYIPGEAVLESEKVGMIERLFQIGNEILEPFYSISDSIMYIKRKSCESAINIEKELIGVFWLAYFNSKYVNFFGRENFDKLGGVDFDSKNGATLKLGKSPAEVPAERRVECERLLGYLSFVDPSDQSFKRPGHYALSLAELEADHTSI